MMRKRRPPLRAAASSSSWQIHPKRGVETGCRAWWSVPCNGQQMGGWPTSACSRCLPAAGAAAYLRSTSCSLSFRASLSTASLLPIQMNRCNTAEHLSQHDVMECSFKRHGLTWQIKHMFALAAPHTFAGLPCWLAAGCPDEQVHPALDKFLQCRPSHIA